ncbi:metal-binding protein ZinT [Onishia taeanensis]
MPFSHASRSRVFALSVLALAGLQSADASQHQHGEHEHGHEPGQDHSHGHNHDHGHGHDHDGAIYAGYFQDAQIEDRPLADWEGDWQSVYPFLENGMLDEVFAYKAAHGGDKTAQAYKHYYETGYQTEVSRIVIHDGAVSFYRGDEEITGTYEYEGFEVLNYEAGNRGVRYLFELAEGAADATSKLPAFIQFSDHAIAPHEAHHFHLYWGDDREALLDEVTNWPTYFPSDMSGAEVAEEMMSH